MSPQLETSLGACRRRFNVPNGASIGREENVIALLDESIPLQGASHADVVEYSVDVPMRYAECAAILADGRKVGLEDPRKFVGWSRHDRNRSLLFLSRGNHYEIKTEADLRGRVPGCVREVYCEAKSERRSSLAARYIGVDGDLVFLPTLPATN